MLVCAQPKPSVSGAVMGLLVLRAALDPLTPVVVGRWEMPIARLLVLHLALDAGTNGAADGLGLSKLLDLLGGALMVTALLRPQPESLRELADWRVLLSYVKSAF